MFSNNDFRQQKILCSLSLINYGSCFKCIRLANRNKRKKYLHDSLRFCVLCAVTFCYGINGFQISVIILVKQRCHKQAIIVCVGVKWFLFNHLSLILIQLRIQEQTEMPLGTIPTLNSQIRHFSKNHEKFSKSGIFDLVFPGRQRSEGKKYKLL